jgi:hypothetical protein
MVNGTSAGRAAFPESLTPSKFRLSVASSPSLSLLPPLRLESSRASCDPRCRQRELRELTGFDRGPNITAEQGHALS